MTREISTVELGELLEKKQVVFAGFVSESQIPRLKRGTIYVITKSRDLVAEVLGGERRNVYVYKKVRP